MESQIDLMMKMFSMSELMNVFSGIDGIKTDNTGMSDMVNLFGMMSDNAPHTDLYNKYMQELDHIFEGDCNNENQSKETFTN